MGLNSATPSKNTTFYPEALEASGQTKKEIKSIYDLPLTIPIPNNWYLDKDTLK